MNNNLLFFYGPDTHSLFRTTQKNIKELIEKYGEHNFIKFFGDEINDWNILQSSLETLPFLGDKRIVLLRDPWNTRKSVWRSQLADFLKAKRLPNSTLLIISETTKPDKRESLFKILSKSGETHEFHEPKPNDLAKKVISEIESLGSKISMNNALKLVSRVGLNGFQLENETQKLALASSNQEITPELITEIVPPSDPTTSIFTLTDALGSRNIQTTLHELQNLFNNGENEFYLLATLSGHFRTLLLISDLIQRNPRAAPSVASELKIHPFVAKKALSQVRNFTLPELKQIFHSLTDLDYSLKTSFDLNPYQEIERLCLRICMK